MSGTSTNSQRTLDRLQSRLDYQFLDPALLEQALTHKSHSRRHNERLEFLGDAVLGYVIADSLYQNHPRLAEDALTLVRASLVRGDTLTEIAVELGLGEFLRLGSGERKSGGRQRASILADALEAIIGAVSLDGGFEAARSLVLKLYESQLQEVDGREVTKDAKTSLQELLQARGLALPTYEVIETRGSEHRRTFVVRCEVGDLSLASSGEGTSRRAAEKAAAGAMIERIESDE